MARIVERPRARQELEDIAAYIGAARPSAAERFLDAAEQAFTLLSQNPGMGRAWASSSPRLQGVRSWTLPRFKRYRIFYRPIEDGIEVLHVFHAARDIETLLEAEAAEEEEQE
jgi:toxin ParE1/3/4